MQFRKNPASTLKYFILALLPFVNIYILWKLAKIIANIEFERGD